MQSTVSLRIAVTLLLMASALPFMLPLFFVAQQEINYYLVAERLEEDALTTIRVSSSDIRQTANSKEILVKGKLFDIKTLVEVEPGQYEITGLFDVREVQIEQRLSGTLDQTTRRHSQEIVQRWLSLIATIPGTGDDVHFTYKSTIPFCRHQLRLTSADYPVVLPPPKT